MFVFTSVVVIGFNPNMVKLPVLFVKGVCPVTIIGMTKLCKGCLYGRRDGMFAGTFFFPSLKTVYMGGTTGRLPILVHF